VNRICVCGLGAVSPAGWGVEKLCAALDKGEPLPTQSLARPGWEKALCVRNVTPPETRPAFFAHPRLRRASTITQHTVAAALEALGEDATHVQSGALRLGIVACTMSGSVAYSRRFYEEVLHEPATASPLVFPETVFNAPASHLAAYLGTNGTGYTLVGDEGTFLQGLAVAADWLLNDQADGVVVVGAEEMDWLVADAVRLFNRSAVHGAGAGAIYLRRGKNYAIGAELAGVTDSFLFTQNQSRTEAVRKMRAQLPAGGAGELLCASVPNISRTDVAEKLAWHDWPGARLAPKAVLGEAFLASAAWQCVAACAALARGRFWAANVSVVGANQQAVGARFLACTKAVQVTGSAPETVGGI
jgi:Beta-ketoacyl synthase, N-terminal domain